MTVLILKQDARKLPLADNTVDLVVTSPPYFALRSYQDNGEHYAGQIGDETTPTEFVNSLIEVTRELVRVVKPTGSIWVNLGDKYALTGGEAVRAKSLFGIPWRYGLRCIDDLGLVLRAEVVWSKPNALPESVTDRVRRAHETWFHFTLGPRYFSAVDALREPHLSVVGGPRRHSGAAFGEDKAGRGGDGSGHTDGHPLGKLPGSVRSVATEPLKVPADLGVKHFAAFPTSWPLWIIKGWCPENGVVLDPFGGTGTTALAAKVLGRDAVHVDLSADYCRLAEWRINDEKQLTKARKKAEALSAGADKVKP